jgi:hypothetical protein
MKEDHLIKKDAIEGLLFVLQENQKLKEALGVLMELKIMLNSDRAIQNPSAVIERANNLISEDLLPIGWGNRENF